MKKYCDGWTDVGREYYRALTTEYKRLWDNQSAHGTIVTHWRRYELENHKSIFKWKASEADNGCSDNEVGIDDSKDETDMSDDGESQSNNDPSFENSTLLIWVVTTLK